MPSSMPHSQSQHQNYTSYPYRSSLSHQRNLTAVAAGLRSVLSSGSHSASVIVKNQPTVIDKASESSGGTSDEHNGGNQREVGGVTAERDLYYMPMPMGPGIIGNEDGTNSLMAKTRSGARGTKRRSLDNDQIDGDTSRKHSKRLTTKEEVALFDICNRHAENFGSRSNLCNWWRTVAAAFTRALGRPYSWHSVRRKVELVTKQRIKSLEDQQQRSQALPGSVPVEELMNPQWRAAIDQWIPTWQRWEQAEARRIEKRDAVRKRRKSQPIEQSSPQTADPASWRIPASNRVSVLTSPGMDVDGGDSFHDEDADPVGDAVLGTTPTPASAPASAVTAPSLESPSISAPAGLRLPPGFESMFSNASPTPTAPSVPVSTTPGPSSDSSMVTTVLETLGKLNKHLDAASGPDGSDPRCSPVISGLVQAASGHNIQSRFPPQQQPQPQRHSPSYTPSSVDIDHLKEELRQEVQAEVRRELDRDRAALEERLDSVQRTQEMILEMLRQEPV
ncbi:hypothetical protein NUU61_002561 [Penicillium alfredii]|uniref:Uncharacterized protein n=1 Tax=Penicillium alfredii TaxID=1506179 RepID=A0A9W9FRZ8_9EURO|nr:uncharacterized protein NUU61_002561 [Penicillium alfredii]KAJ5105214.1 hypothetical protein NUU61_002561 [Penicillium alfredii]